LFWEEIRWYLKDRPSIWGWPLFGLWVIFVITGLFGPFSQYDYLQEGGNANYLGWLVPAASGLIILLVIYFLAASIKQHSATPLFIMLAGLEFGVVATFVCPQISLGALWLFSREALQQPVFQALLNGPMNVDPYFLFGGGGFTGLFFVLVVAPLFAISLLSLFWHLASSGWRRWHHHHCSSLPALV